MKGKKLILAVIRLYRFILQNGPKIKQKVPFLLLEFISASLLYLRLKEGFRRLWGFFERGYNRFLETFFNDD